MEKEELIKIATELNQEALSASSFFSIIKQYRDMQKDYMPEIRLSPAFYQVVYEALQKACFMEIARLFDKSSGTMTIGKLLDLCNENINLFPENRSSFTVIEEGKTYTFPIPYQHQLKPNEERYFQDLVNSQREIFKIFDVPNAEKAPVRVDLTFPEFLGLYRKRFVSLKKKQENVQKQRNKIYAHNDKDTLGNSEDITSKYPISYMDIEELIDFAQDCTGLVLGVLTDISHARKYSNIDDWIGTLMLARLGLKYQQYDMEQREKELMKELQIDMRRDGNG